MSAAVGSLTPDKRIMAFLLGAIALVALPHALHIPAVLFSFFLLTLGWRFAAIGNKALLPGRIVLFCVAMLGAGLIVVHNQGIFGRDAGTSLFIVALGLKLLEVKRSRDVYLVVFLSFFVAITQFLYSQSLLMAVYILVTTCLLTASLIGLNGQSKLLTILDHIRTAALLLVQAVPVMIILFVLFPRITPPELKFPMKQETAVTGLSDTLEPGQISRLSQSEATAFRVTFESAMPPANQRYWRGPVFWRTNGSRWTLPKENLLTDRKVQTQGLPYRYKVMLEPHEQKWLFALDLPAVWPTDVDQTTDFLLLTNKKVSQRKAYRLASYTRYNTGGLTDSERKKGLQLPGRPSPRIESLVKRWRNASSSNGEIINKALDYFNQQPFVYTLTPPTLDRDPVDEFLFETRRGFCEHYATAFVYLMRAANIPARVVTGYQGGEYNPIGKFLEIRQADAHAWTEVWLAEKGWQRIDPTAAVAPERIERGVDLDSQIDTGKVSFGIGAPSGIARMFQQARFAWASLDHAWHRWVISYSAANQTRFLSLIGIEDIRTLIFWLTGSVAAIVAIVALSMLREPRPSSEKSVRLFKAFLSKLAAKGLVKKPSEGPYDFATRAITARPELAAPINDITATYLNIRYGRLSATETDDVKKLRQLIYRFRA